VSRYDENELIAEAEHILGDDQTVVAAGYFGLKDLFAAQVAGGTAGAAAGKLATDGGLAAGVGAALGGAAATRAFAESQGVTVQLLVALTEQSIHELNRDTGGRLPERVVSFDRHTATVHISKVGLSRMVEISDDSGARIELHGTALPLSQLSKGDKAVLAELVS